MWQEFIWACAWVLIKWALGVTSDMITEAIRLVQEANDLKHEDGTPFTGDEKKNWVINHLADMFDTSKFKDTWKSTLSSLTNLAWSYAQKVILQKV